MATIRDKMGHSLDFTGRRLAIVDTDCDVDLWDLAALSGGLTDITLASNSRTGGTS